MRNKICKAELCTTASARRRGGYHSAIATEPRSHGATKGAGAARPEGRGSILLGVLGALAVYISGCGGAHAIVEMDTANMLLANAEQARAANEEYATDLAQLDLLLRALSVNEFVTGVQATHDQPGELAMVQATFLETMTRLESNHNALVERGRLAEDRVRTVEEAAEGLQALARREMILDNAVGSLVERYFTLKAEAKKAAADRAAQKKAACATTLSDIVNRVTGCNPAAPGQPAKK